MDTKGYYKSLGIKKNASDDEIKKSFRKLSIKYHPDKQSGKTDAEKKKAEEKFKEINEAYQVLSDPEKRRNYDQTGSVDGGFAGFNKSSYNDMNDIFNQFFNGMPHDDFNDFFREKTQQVTHGSDIRMSVPLTFEEVYNGCTKKLKFTRKVRCTNCHGDGGTGKKVCKTCNGTGYVTYRQNTPMGYVQSSMPCKVCQGKGTIYEHICPTCNGTGFNEIEEIVEVNIPAGMPEGYSLQIVGKGNEAKDKRGNNGDFYVIAKYVFDKSKYNIQGLDVIESITIPYYDHYLGTSYIINIPDGTKKKINIPNNLQEGSTLRLPNCGIKGTGNNLSGDYYVEVHTILPNDLSDKELDLLKEIKKLHE